MWLFKYANQERKCKKMPETGNAIAALDSLNKNGLLPV